MGFKFGLTIKRFIFGTGSEIYDNVVFRFIFCT